MKIKYEDHRFQKKNLDLLQHIDRIINSYNDQGFTLTVRQCYYQLVSENKIENVEKNYDRIVNLLKNGRLSGQLDIDVIEDRTRYSRAHKHFDSIKDFLKIACNSYRIDLWAGNPYYTEVWVEKDSLIGIVEDAASQYDVPCFSCRGFPSITALWQAAQRIKNKVYPVIFYLGDHDPSGLKIEPEIQARLEQFEARPIVKRIGLTLDQVNEFNLPPNFAKESDNNYEQYKEKYGEFSWELDALKPEIIYNLVIEAIKTTIDPKTYNKALNRQKRERRQILKLIETI